MKEDWLERIESFPGKTGVYYQDLTTGEERMSLGEEPFLAASVIKLPILVEAFRRLESGEASEDEEFVVQKEDHLPSCGALGYMHPGLRVTYLDLCTLMVILSDNTATNLLIRRLGMEEINRTMEAMGMEGCALRRRLFDSEAAARGLENTITPAAVGRLLAALFRGEVVSPAASSRMIQILLNQRLNGKLPFFLDKRVKCAHKTGEDSGITHDAGILYAQRPFVLGIFGNDVDAPGLNLIMAETARQLVQKHGMPL